MVNALQRRLHELYYARTPYPMIGGQMVGLESYRLVANGNAFYTLLEAADRIGALEAALREEHGGKHHEPECPLCAVLAEGSTCDASEKQP
jgi:hypothetical protein